MADTLDAILHKLPDNGKIHREIKVITIRVSSDLHSALRQEAKERNTSVNRLAVAKLSLKAEVLDHVVEAMAELANSNESVV